MATKSSPNKGLGKGFGALLSSDFDDSILADKDERIIKVAVSKVEPNKDQPRKVFDQVALQELADSIKQYGVLQPLVVTKESADKYSIIAGERRWRASQLAGLDTVPVVVRSSEELERLEIALVENVQRVDLSPLEQALSIQHLHEQFSMSYTDIATKLGKASTTINNIVRLLQLPDEAKDALRDGKISEGHARAILALKGDASRQKLLLDNIVNYGWSVRQAEQFVTSTKKGDKAKKATSQTVSNETDETKKLSKRLKSPVTIKRTAKGGRLEIHFKDDKQLDKIIEDLL